MVLTCTHINVVLKKFKFDISEYKIIINIINDWIRLFHSRIENIEMGFSYFSEYMCISVQGGPKKVYLRKSAWEILKYFLIESFPLYTHIFSRIYSFLSYVEESYEALKILKMACTKKVTLSKRYILSQVKIALEITKLIIWLQKCVFLKRL